jgi:hypothetical protein
VVVAGRELEVEVVLEVDAVELEVDGLAEDELLLGRTGGLPVE